MVRRKQQKLSSTHCFLSVHFKHVFPTPVLECPLACLLRRAVSPQVSQLGPHEDSPVAKPRPLVSNHMRLLKKGSHVLQFVSFFFLSCYKISFLKKEQEKKQHRLRFFFSSPLLSYLPLHSDLTGPSCGWLLESTWILKTTRPPVTPCL